MSMGSAASGENLPDAPEQYSKRDQQLLRAAIVRLFRRVWWVDRDMTPQGSHILTSPNGTHYKLVVSDAGALSTTLVS